MSWLERDWESMHAAITGLATDELHTVEVAREAIPLIFVPGIMGSRLRRSGTNGTGRGSDGGFGLPNLRWDPADKSLMAELLTMSAAKRKMLIIGPSFDPDYLEVDNASPVGDGFRGLFADYRGFLESLRDRDWGPLSKLFEFPVYGFGYNWTHDNRMSGARLAARIDEIIAEARAVVGRCEKVILITHSMGGLVSRAASQLSGAAGKILGIVHGVQPVTGSGATYWRMKAGFEGSYGVSYALGSNGMMTTPILCNSPGGLELLPTKRYRTSNGGTKWLDVPLPSGHRLELPESDPYEEIYRVKAEVQIPPGSVGASKNTFWGLVDPRLLVPESVPATEADSVGPNDTLADKLEMNDAWLDYLDLLDKAESFHDALGLSQHPNTFTFWGGSSKSVERVHMVAETVAVDWHPYQTQGFYGYFANSWGAVCRAVIQPPSQWGDGTVPSVSGSALARKGRAAPGDVSLKIGHQPAYEDAGAQAFTVRAILALCRMHMTAKAVR